MSTITLYPSAPPLGPIGLGGSTFGRETDEAAASAMMDRAYARGVTLFDTAATYSKGASEQIVGGWLASRRPGRETLTIATKIYPPYTPAAIDEAAAASAIRLGVDVIDILFLHKWDPAAETAEALTALDSLVPSGRVRVLGVSNFTSAQLMRVLSLQAQLGLAPFRVLQNNHNLAVREVDDALRALCAERGIAIVTYSPLGGGFLTGKHRFGVQPGSRFDVAPGHRDVYFHSLPERRLARLTQTSALTGHAMAQLALAWALHQPGIDCVLIGGRNPSHIDQAFAALLLDDPALFSALDAGDNT